MKKICLLASLMVLLEILVTHAAPLLRMQFTTDTDNAAPATAPAITGTTSIHPTALLNASGTSIIIRTSPIDGGTSQMFEPGKVMEMNYSGTGSGPTIRFDGATGDAANSGKLRVDLDLMIDSGTMWSGTVPTVVVWTGTLCATLKDLSDAPVCTTNINLSTGQINLVASGTDGSSPTPVLLGVAPMGNHLHLQVLLDYASSTATLTGDNLLYNPSPLAYTRTISGTFASARSFGRLDLSLLGGTGKVSLDNLCINAIANYETKSVADYLAVGDGITDDTAALQTAFGNLGKKISKLSFVAGKTYVISGKLAVSNQSDFQIEGNMATIKVKNGGAVDSLNTILLFFHNCENYTVQDLTVDANRANRGIADTNSQTMIYTQNARLFRYINLHSINGVFDGFYISADNHIDPETFSRDGLLLNCEAIDCFRQGISITNANHIGIVGGQFSHITGTSPSAGIDIEANDDAVHNDYSYRPSNIGILIRDAVFDSNDGSGVQVSDTGMPRNITIEDSSFFHCGEAFGAYGILLGSSDSFIQNNFFENFSFIAKPGITPPAGIVYLKGYQTNGNNIISNNWFAHIHTTKPVISVALSAGSGIRLNNNVVTDIDVLHPFGSPGSNTTISGNVTSFAPVGYWALDSSSGTTLLDASGNAINGVAHNSPAWVPGKYGNALSFNGTNQYGVMVHSGTLDVTASFTLAAWFKADATSDDSSHIVLGKASDFRFGYEGRSDFGFYSPLTGWVTTPVTKGAWHHAAVTFDGNRVRLYIDGVQAKNCEVKPGGINKDGQVYIGTIASTTYPFQGLIDDVRMYNVVLSQSEIQSVYSLLSTP